MRILIHGANFYPERIGIGKYSGEMAEWLATRGHEVRVVTAPPYYPEWRVRPDYSCWKFKCEVLKGKEATSKAGGLTVWRCPLWVPARPSGLKRILHLASFALSSFPVMVRQIFWRPDIVLVVEPPLFCTPQALSVARLTGAKAWLHVQDFEIDAAFDLGIVKPGWLKNLFFSVESWLMRRFDRVSTISEVMLGKLVAKGVVPDKAVLFPNWVNLEIIKPDAEAGRRMRSELSLPAHAKLALYSGNIGEKQGLEYVIEAARLLQEIALIFVICGDGSAKFRLQSMSKDLSNIRWLPLQPIERLNDLLNMPDMHLLPQLNSAADLVMPSKLTGIFACGRPLIAMASSGTSLYEAVNGHGFVVAPENHVALSRAIMFLINNVGAGEEFGIKARQFAVSSFCRESILRDFETGMSLLCKDSVM